MSKRRKKLLWTVLLLGIPTAAIIYCNAAIDEAAKGRLYDNVDAIPFRKTALLLGTAKYLQDGRLNQYYTHRIEAAVALYRGGKIRYILASGDNKRQSYNEPMTMRADLMAAGVDSSHIYVDYAGFRTFDSIIRLRDIFSQDSVTIISQPFHNERALFIASREHIDAIGFNAQDVQTGAGIKVQLREKLARVKVFVDELTGEEPHFLGPKIPFPEE